MLVQLTMGTRNYQLGHEAGHSIVWMDGVWQIEVGFELVDCDAQHKIDQYRHCNLQHGCAMDADALHLKLDYLHKKDNG